MTFRSTTASTGILVLVLQVLEQAGQLLAVSSLDVLVSRPPQEPEFLQFGESVFRGVAGLQLNKATADSRLMCSCRPFVAFLDSAGEVTGILVLAFDHLEILLGNDQLEADGK